MNTKFLLGAAIIAAAASGFAAPEITIKSTPELPGKNLISTSDFSKGVLGSWSVNTPANRKFASIDKTEGVGDKMSMKLAGNVASSPNLYHRLRPAVPFKAGEPYYIRYYAKRVGSNPKYRSGGSLAFTMNNGKYKYAQVPEHNAGDSDWAEYDYNGVIPADSKYGTLYMCYYKQTGYTLYDNVEFRHGWAELDISVKGKGLQAIVVRNSVTGTVLKEKINGSEYNKTVKVPAFGSNSVEVLDRTGEVTGKLYPENVDSNVAASDKIIPLTPVKRVIVPAKTTESFTVAMPAMAGKKAYLCFTARLNKKSGIAGYTNALKVKVNGKVLGMNNVVKPGKVIVLKGTPNKKANIANGSSNFIVFYSNVSAPIPQHNRYCPTSVENGNPFDFKLDVTKQLEEGLNTVDFQSGVFLKETKLYLENLHIVIE